MTWPQMQEAGFYRAPARFRAGALLDEGSFKELVGPELGITSEHLAELGEAVAFDDGIVVAAGRIAGRPAFVISQEGRFIGGSVGEVGGAKMVGAFLAALSLYEKAEQKYPGDGSRHPALVISFETGGVRLHEANAGLLAHAEIMELLQRCRGKVPVIALVGSRLGCFGGMGFVAAACDVLIMSERGRIGLTGPEIIEQVMGKKEFDSRDRALIYRTTGGKNRYILGDCAFLVEDSLGAFRTKVMQALALPPEEFARLRLIGTPELLARRLEMTALAADLKPRDATEVWAHFGNPEPEAIPDMEHADFLRAARTAKGGPR
ncbi:MAG: biotin-independent malonate decarboxylase subunit beta [Treponema sp.]|nr:biotin-independent malonate decarboxylase subunit beta [Treponema sp.]